MNQPARNSTAMPKWLLYGLIAKGVLVVVIVLIVLWYAGILG
jgi:hypothetical protein